MKTTKSRGIWVSFVVTFLLVLLLVGPGSVLSNSQQKKHKKNSQPILEVSFDQGVPAAEVLRLMPSKQVKVQYLMYHWGEHTGWYLLRDDQSLEDALRDFEQKHVDFLTRRINNANQQPAIESLGDNPSEQSELEESRAKLRQDFLDQLYYIQKNGLLLSGFAVSDDSETLQSITEALPKDKVSTRILTNNEERPEPKAKGRFQTQATSGIPYPDNPWKFSPSYGTIAYDASAKYFYNDFFWTDVSGFTSVHSAYEHNITIWSAKDTYVRAGGGTFYSNLPSAYIDSTAFDDYASFTIGSGAATSIRANSWYYADTPVQVINANAGPSSGDVQAQLGSWAGAYNSGWSFWQEPLEGAYCLTHGNNYPNCIFPDQTQTMNNYYPSSGSNSVPDFPFDHRTSATFSWSKDVAAPRINPGSLSSSGPVTASISTVTSGATIRYTTNGTDPTSSSTIYTGPLTFTSSVTLKARAFKNGLSDSSVASVTYSITSGQKVATPVISPGSGSYSGSVTASITTATSGATIRYTTNGTDPTSSSSIYTGPLTFTSSVTLKARAFKSGLTDSDVASASYTFSNPPGAFNLRLTPECSGSSPQIRLNWDTSNGAQSYDIYRNGSLYTSGITGTQFINTVVTGGVSYTYFVRAKNSAGSTDSNTLSATAPSNCGISPPGAFTLTLTPECNGSSPQIRLNWSTSNGAQTYDVYRNGGLYSSSVSGTQFINTAVTAGISYSYFVRARNSADSTDTSTSSATAPTNCGVVLPGPFTLTLTPECSGTTPQIRLNWTVSSGAQSYDVYRNGSLYYSNVGGTQFINTAVTAGAGYSYFVRAKNGSGSRDSNAASANAPSNCAPAEIIVDDLSSGFSRFGPSQYWSQASIGYNGHMYYTLNNTNVVQNYAIWTPNLSSGGAGFYAVYVYIPNNFADTRNAVYTIFHNGTSDVRVVNQSLYFNQWVSLGTFYFTGNGSEYVKLTDSTGESSLSRRIGFDAVKWVKQ